jgi:uncharacterized repeat protein (TIGR01451 family)/fimbrial isopeptide formation D2 family protein
LLGRQHGGVGVLRPARAARMARAARCALGAALVCAGTLGAPALAQAENSPAITLSVGSPAHVLYGSRATVTLSAENPSGQPYGYNLSYRAVLPSGASFVAGSTHSGSGGTVPAPEVIANEPSAGKTTLIWSNVGDLSPSSHNTLSFEVTPSTVTYTVGSSFLVEGGAYIAKEPRYLPKFGATGTPEGPEPHSFTGSATGSASSTITAIEVSQSSSAGAILRGVHDHQTVYKVTVTNNSVKPTTNVTLDDWLPAALEYLGCGGPGVDHTTNAPTNLGSSEEYPGSGPIEVAPLGGCSAPELVETTEAEPDPAAGDVKGVYTHLHWSLGTLEAGQTRTYEFRAAVPIRENTLTWTGAKPTAASGNQAPNLDNNSGKETRDGESITTFAEAAGKFEGTTAVSSNDTLTRVAKDITTEKSASTNVLADGQVTKWTIVLHSSEYRYNTAITVTDTLPNGLCPLSSVNLTSSSECEPNGDEPSFPYLSATEAANGTWALVWNDETDGALANLEQNASTTITFYSKTRSHYQSGHAQSTPILANDTVTNEALANATTNVVCANDTDCSVSTEHINHERPLSEPVSAAAGASQSAEGPTIAKKIAISGTECLGDTYTTSTPVYHPGDLVCWLVEASFPSALSTHGSVVTDFLPGSVVFDEAFNSGAGEAATASDTLPTTGFSHAEAGHSELGGVLTWTLPESGFVGNGGQRLERVFATTAKLPTSATPGDLQGNLMKFASINTPGESFALRQEANYELQFPDLGLTKKIVKLAGASISPTSSATVKGSEEAEFALTISNAGELAAKHVEVWDEQPTGLQCEDIVSISNNGACVGGRISWGETGLGEEEVGVPSKGEMVLHFTAKVPANINPGTTLIDHAGVREYQSETNTGSFYTYIPKENIDPTLDSEANMPAAKSEATLSAENVTFEKKNTSSVVETGNTGAQATIGEQVTFEVSVKIPAGTTLSGRAKISDPTLPEASPQRMEYEAHSVEALVNGSPAVGEFTTEEPSGSPVLLLPENYEAPSTESRKVTMRFKVRVTNASKNFAGGTAAEKKIKNTGKLAWTNPLAGAQTREASDEVSLVEPSIKLTQSNNSGGPVHGGQLVEYKLELSNTAGDSSAFSNKIVDNVPSGLIPSKESGEPLLNGEATESGGVWDEGTRTITWEPATKLEGGHAQTYKFFAKVVNEPVAASQLKNTATATAASLLASEYPLARTAANAPTASSRQRYESSTEASLEVEGSALAKSSDSPTATIGHRITYTLTVTIPAHVVAYNETVIDTLPDSLDFDEYVGAECTSGCPPEVETRTYTPHIAAANTTVAWYLGNIAAASTARTVKLTYRASVRSTHRSGGAKIEAPAEIKNGAVLYYNQTEKGPFVEGTIPAPESFDKKTATQTATSTVVEPKLTLVKEASVNGGPYSTAHASLTDGDIVAYRLSVKNNGTSPADDVTVADKPSSRLEAVTPTENASDVSKNVVGEIAWSVPGPIAVGETITLGYSAKLVPVTELKPGDEVNNEATVPSYFGLPEAERTAGHKNYAGEDILYREYGGLAAQVTASVQLPAISIEKTTGTSGFPSSANAEVGQPFKWRVVIKNTSSVAATSVAVTDHLPANWEYVAHSAGFAPGGALEPSESGTLGGGKELAWHTSIELAAGQSTVLSYEAKPMLAAETDPGSGEEHANENTASATVKDAQGNAEDENGPFAAGPASARAILILPKLEVSKTPVKASVNAGEADSYHVRVSNSGAATAREARVVDTFPSGMSYTPGTATAEPASGFSEASATSSSATWAIESIAPGGAVEITVPVGTSAALASGTKLINEVAATSSELTTPVEANGTIETTTSADLEAHKRVASAGGAVPGRHMTYEVGATNNGPSVAHGVKLQDQLPGSVTYVSASEPGCGEVAGKVTCEVSELAVGETKSFQIVVAVPSGATGTIKNAVVVSSETPDPEPGNNEASVESETEPKAELKLTKTTLTPEVLNGQQARFKLAATNDGPSDAEGAKIVDTLPSRLTYVSASGASCSALGQEVTCSLGTLHSGESATVEITVSAHGVGTDVNHATASSEAENPEPSGASAESSVEVLPAAQLKLEKTVSPTFVTLPGRVTYTLKVENEGPDAAQNVVVTDPLPTGISYASDDAGCTVAGQRVTCEIGELANGSSRTIHLHTHVAVTIAEALITNTAEATSTTGDPEPAKARGSAELQTGPAADLAIVKTGPASVVRGNQIAWTLSVSNRGPSTAHRVSVSDPLPAGVAYAGSSASQGSCQYASGTLTCELGTFANGASASISVGGTVSAEPGELVNTATVSAEEPDPEPANNSSSAVTQISAVPVVDPPANPAGGVGPANDSALRTRVTLRKLVDRTATAPGGRLTYRLIVRNTGARTARRVKICDVLPAQTSVVSRGGGHLGAGRLCFPLNALAPGRHHTFKLVLRADSTAHGEIVNRAVVSGENFPRTHARASTRVRGTMLPRRESAVTG